MDRNEIISKIVQLNCKKCYKFGNSCPYVQNLISIGLLIAETELPEAITFTINCSKKED